MIFHYEEITSEIKRPIIPIFLKSKTIFIFYHAIIDSGADYCIFSLDIAQILELRLSSKDKVIFAEIADFGHGILGQKGFFDHFDVSLSYKDQSINLISR